MHILFKVKNIIGKAVFYVWHWREQSLWRIYRQDKFGRFYFILFLRKYYLADFRISKRIKVVGEYVCTERELVRGENTIRIDDYFTGANVKLYKNGRCILGRQKNDSL